MFGFFILDVNDCVDVTCQNRGSCLDGIDGFTCVCVDGFSGENCQIGKISNSRDSSMN